MNYTAEIDTIKDVSLIIPCQNAVKQLLQLLRFIQNWAAIPNEIIIIDSSSEKFYPPEDLKLFTERLNIKLLVIYGDNLYPGHARNIGVVNATNSTLAFLDTSTHPNERWLSSGLNLMRANNSQGVWGSTYYQADYYMPQIILI